MNQTKKTQVYLSNTGPNLPALTFGDDTSTGLYHSGKGVIGISGEVMADTADIGNARIRSLGVGQDAIIAGTLTPGIANLKRLFVSPSNPPTSNTARGDTGEVIIGFDRIYVCVAPNLWRATAINTF